MGTDSQGLIQVKVTEFGSHRTSTLVRNERKVFPASGAPDALTESTIYQVPPSLPPHHTDHHLFKLYKYDASYSGFLWSISYFSITVIKILYPKAT